jgi:hypothetical protein
MNDPWQVVAGGKMIALPDPVAASACTPWTIGRSVERFRGRRKIDIGRAQVTRTEPAAKGLRELDPAASERCRERIQVQRLDNSSRPTRRTRLLKRVLLFERRFEAAGPLPKRAPRIAGRRAIRPYGHSFGEYAALTGHVSRASVEHLVEVPSADLGEGPEKVVEKHALTLTPGGRQVVCEAIEPAPEAPCVDSAHIRHRVLTSRRNGLCPIHPDTANSLFHT